MKLFTSALTGAVLFAAFAQAEAVTPDQVVFDEAGAVSQSLTGVPGDAGRGAAVMTDRGLGNCVACHQISSLSAPFQGDVGPSLDGVGDRYDVAALRGIVANAKRTFDGSVMPPFYKDRGFIRPGIEFTAKPATEPLAPILAAQDVEDVVAFLSTLK